jgi:hypothetical protein
MKKHPKRTSIVIPACFPAGLIFQTSSLSVVLCLAKRKRILFAVTIHVFDTPSTLCHLVRAWEEQARGNPFRNDRLLSNRSIHPRHFQGRNTRIGIQGTPTSAGLLLRDCSVSTQTFACIALQTLLRYISTLTMMKAAPLQGLLSVLVLVFAVTAPLVQCAYIRGEKDKTANDESNEAMLGFQESRQRGLVPVDGLHLGNDVFVGDDLVPGDDDDDGHVDKVNLGDDDDGYVGKKDGGYGGYDGKKDGGYGDDDDGGRVGFPTFGKKNGYGGYGGASGKKGSDCSELVLGKKSTFVIDVFNEDMGNMVPESNDGPPDDYRRVLDGDDDDDDGDSPVAAPVFFEGDDGINSGDDDDDGPSIGDNDDDGPSFGDDDDDDGSDLCGEPENTPTTLPLSTLAPSDPPTKSPSPPPTLAPSSLPPAQLTPEQGEDDAEKSNDDPPETEPPTKTPLPQI